MKLYKFRPLANENDLKYIIKIIKTGKFWCSKLWNLNDPMEGVYWTTISNKDAIKRNFSEKNNFVICSFSGKNALKNPLLWGYYANGFKGVAIEIEIDEEEVDKVCYTERMSEFNRLIEIRKIITTKLKFWKHEDEYRYLKLGGENHYKIGEIKKIYFGAPYSNVINFSDINKNSKKIEKYNQFKRELIKICKKNKIKTEFRNLRFY